MAVDYPLVSVVLITFNSGRYVAETLTSIKAQKYQNIELIVSDDGSTDQSVEICRQWSDKNADRFTRFEIIPSPVNTGIPGNCNRGLRKANGDWVKFIAGDDLLLENCIADNVNWCRDHPGTAVLFSESKKMDEEGNELDDQLMAYQSEKRGWRTRFFDLPIEKQLKTYARKPLFLQTPTAFYNRKILAEVDGFDENLKIFEDIPGNFRVLNAGYPLSHMPVYTVVYRISRDSVSKRKEPGMDLKRLNEFGYIFDTYRKPQLSFCNSCDVLPIFDAWLDFTWTLKYRLPGARFIKKLFGLSR